MEAMIPNASNAGRFRWSKTGESVLSLVDRACAESMGDVCAEKTPVLFRIHVLNKTLGPFRADTVPEACDRIECFLAMLEKAGVIDRAVIR